MANEQATGPLVVANEKREVARAWADGRIQFAPDVSADEMKGAVAYFMARDLEQFAKMEPDDERALEPHKLANVRALSSSGPRVFVALTNNRVFTHNVENDAGTWHELPPIPGTFVQAPTGIVYAGVGEDAPAAVDPLERTPTEQEIFYDIHRCPARYPDHDKTGLVYRCFLLAGHKRPHELRTGTAWPNV